MEDPPGWTIDRLAARAGMTVRNVRAHAARGLLPPPRMQGRTGYYDHDHLARLELITRLQSEGFSLAAIERLVGATPHQSAESAISLYLEMLAPWQVEPPLEMGRDEISGWLGVEHTDDDHAALREAGLVEDLDGARVRLHSPALLQAGAEARRLGMPLADLLAVRRRVVDRVETIVDDFAELFRRTVWRQFVDAGLPPARFDEVRVAVAALQPIAARTVMSAFRETMPRAVGDLVREASRDLGATGEPPRP